MMPEAPLLMSWHTEMRMKAWLEHEDWKIESIFGVAQEIRQSKGRHFPCDILCVGEDKCALFLKTLRVKA